METRVYGQPDRQKNRPRPNNQNWSMVVEYVAEFEKATWQRYQKAFHQNLLNEAANLCHRGLQRNPRSVRWTLGLALICFKRGQPQRALKHAKRALKFAPNEPLVNKTIKLIQSGMGPLAHRDPTRHDRQIGTVLKILEKEPPQAVDERSIVDPMEQHNILYDKPRRGFVRRVFRLFFLCGLLGGAVFGVLTLVQVYQEEQHREVLREVAPNLRQDLQNGELARVAELLAQKVGPENICAVDYENDLIVRSEATLYRLFDADPNRRKRIRQCLKSMKTESETKDLIIAKVMLASQRERILWLGHLKRLDDENNQDPDVPYLMASAYAAKHKYKLAAAAYARAHELGPKHLAHYAADVAFQITRGKKDQAQKLVETMNVINPDSSWTWLCKFWLGRADPQSVPAELPAPVAAEWRLEQARRAKKKGQVSIVNKRLKQAKTQVSRQPEFLSDFYQQLLAYGQRDIAAKL